MEGMGKTLPAVEVDHNRHASETPFKCADSGPRQHAGWVRVAKVSL